MKYKISIIIPIYNNAPELKKSMDSLLSQTFKKTDFEVIVVDDGSKEDMKSVVQSYADKISTKYFYQEDKGFRPGTARNIGIREANGELCIFIDCGMILDKNCLEEHYRVYSEGYGNEVAIGYVYGNDIHSDLQEMRNIIDNHSPEEAIEIMTKKNMVDGRETLYQEFGDNLSIWPVPWVVLWSLHFSVPTEFLRKNEIYFDEYFNTWGCEDNDFGIQLYNYGAKYVLGRNIKAIHYPAKVRSYDRLKNEPDFKNNFKKNQLYVLSKYNDNRGVKLWYEKGFFNVNKILLEEKKMSECIDNI